MNALDEHGRAFGTQMLSNGKDTVCAFYLHAQVVSES